MLSIAEGIFIFLATTESVLGILGNGFIGLVNCIEYVKNRKISRIDCILTGVAISRFCVIWVIMVHGYIQVFFPHMLSSGSLVEYVSYVWVTINHLNVWFSTNLNIFYLLKIANFSHYMFLWLKRRINTVFLFLIGWLCISLILSFLHMVNMIHNSKVQYKNVSRQVYLHKREFIIDLILSNVSIFLLFTIALVTCFMLIIALWRHNRRMKLNGMGCRDLNTEGHVKALRVLVTFIILFIVHFIGIALEMVSVNMLESKLLFIVGVAATCLYPCGHSFVLILENSKFKQTILMLLRHFKCWEAGRNLSSP